MSSTPKESLSKQEIINEYGNSFSSEGSSEGQKVIESFGKNHSVITDYKFDGEGLLNHIINQAKESINKEIAYLRNTKQKLSEGFLSSFLQKGNVEKINKKIMEMENRLRNIEAHFNIQYLEDCSYLIPKERLHEGEEVFIVDFFMKPYSPILKTVKVKRVDISIEDRMLKLFYLLDDKDNTQVNYNKDYKLTTDYDDRYIFKTKEEAVLNAERLVYGKIGSLVSNLEAIKK